METLCIVNTLCPDQILVLETLVQIITKCNPSVWLRTTAPKLGSLLFGIKLFFRRMVIKFTSLKSEGQGNKGSDGQLTHGHQKVHILIPGTYEC